jgi:predicted Zn-dependent protease
MKKLILIGFAIGVFTGPFGCVRNPATGKRQIVLVSEAEEISMGQKSDPWVREEYGVAAGQRLQDYVEGLGHKLVRVSHRPNLEWHFTVVDSPVVNAFALPGGYVYVTRGILAYLGNEAELAGVMGHEIGHVTARHSVRQITTEEFAQIGLGAGSVMSPALSQLGSLAQSGLGMMFLRFGRDDEREADRLSVEYAARAAYDPRQVSSFFDVLGRFSAAEDRQTIPGWLSTHPNPPDRVEATRKEAEEWIQMLGLPEERMNVNRDPFLREIDGMTFGSNPREGFSVGRRFYHPELEFQIEFPADWRIDNAREAVIATEPQRRGSIQLTVAAAPRGMTARDYIRALALRGLLPVRTREVQIHGYSAILTNYSGASAAFIEFREKIYQIVGVGRLKDGFEQTVQSFDRITDERILNVKPDRLKIYEAKEGDTLRSLADQGRNPRVTADDLAVLNRMAIDQPITPGRLVKLVEVGY